MTGLRSQFWDRGAECRTQSTGKVMVRVRSGAGYWLRTAILGVASVVTVLAISTDPADARRRKYRKARHVAASTYNPPQASIVVDANSGKVLQASNADAQRHPASLTKIMTLYMLFERLEAGKLSLDSEMDVSAHAASQAPTKLGLRPGQTLEVEDAIKALVTKSANDAAVVIAEHLGGDEEKFAQMMTRKARALGMSRTTYQNASGLPDPDQITTARDQALLGRAIQDRFPKHYRYFATTSFSYRGRAMRNHNKLLGRVEGVDGIKTGYTRASGFNLVSSVRRGNRHIVSVVLGGRSGGSRDALMRNLIATHIDDAASRRTVAKIQESTQAETRLALAPRKAKPAKVEESEDTSEEVAEDASETPNEVADTQSDNADKAVPAKSGADKAIAEKSGADKKMATAIPAPQAAPAQSFAAIPAPAARPDNAPPASGVISTPQVAALEGSTAPIKPVSVKTVVVRTQPMRVASAPIAATDDKAIETRNANARNADARSVEDRGPTASINTTAISAAPLPAAKLPPVAGNHGSGQGVLGVLPANIPNVPAQDARRDARAELHKSQDIKSQELKAPGAAVAKTAPTVKLADAKADIKVSQPVEMKKPAAHTGWVIQIGAFESEAEARQRLDSARASVKGVLAKADPFTEAVAKGDKKLYRARFAGFEKDDAENACRYLKRNHITCITVRN